MKAVGGPDLAVPPASWSDESLRAFCNAAGYAYGSWSPFLGADFLAAELQAAQTALASAGAARQAAEAAAPPPLAALLAAEVQALSRAVGLPRVSQERLLRTPEAVLAQVREAAECSSQAPAFRASLPASPRIAGACAPLRAPR